MKGLLSCSFSSLNSLKPFWLVAGRSKLTWACGHTWQSHECPTLWRRRWTQRRADRRKDSIWRTPRCWGGLWGWRSPDPSPGSTSYTCDLEEVKRGVSNRPMLYTAGKHIGLMRSLTKHKIPLLNQILLLWQCKSAGLSTNLIKTTVWWIAMTSDYRL